MYAGEGTEGHAGTPLPRKLGVPETGMVVLLGAPAGFESRLGPLPAGVRLRRRLRGAPDVVVFFTKSRSRLEARIGALAGAIYPDRALWVAWPKRASGVATDVTEDVVRRVCLPVGLVDVKVAAIDGTWSGLKIVWRRESR